MDLLLFFLAGVGASAALHAVLLAKRTPPPPFLFMKPNLRQKPVSLLRRIYNWPPLRRR